MATVMPTAAASPTAREAALLMQTELLAEGLGADGGTSPRAISQSVRWEDLDGPLGTPGSREEAAEDEQCFLERELSMNQPAIEATLSGWSFTRARASSVESARKRVSRNSSDPTYFRKERQWRIRRPPARSGTSPSVLGGRESGGLLWPLLRTVVTPDAGIVMEERLAKQAEAFERQKLHHDNEQTCAERLQQLRKHQRFSWRHHEVLEVEDLFDLEEEMECLVTYKNTYATARLLHYAVWYSWHNRERNAESVRLVLNAQADPNAKAEYQSFSGMPKTYVGAIHIAAGQGYVPAMEALWQRAQTRTKHKELVNMPCTIGAERHYTPIHDAVYGEQKDAAVWLLQHKAAPNERNRDGFTPLHWLAFKALPREEDLKELLLCLLRSKADLKARTYFHKFNAHFSLKTPLEMAALPGSAFPQRFMYLLAPSWHRDLKLVVMNLNVQGGRNTDNGAEAPLSPTRTEESPSTRRGWQSFSAHTDVVCVQEGVTGQDWLRQAGFKMVDCSFQANRQANEIYIREEGCKWEAVEHGCETISEGPELVGGQHLAPRFVAWAKLRPKGQSQGLHVYLLNCQLTGGGLKDDDVVHHGLLHERAAQVERAVAMFEAKARPNDVAILAGDLSGSAERGSGSVTIGTTQADSCVDRAYGNYTMEGRRFRLETSAARLRAPSGESVQSLARTRTSAPLAALYARGWQPACSEAQMGIRGWPGYLACCMATSRLVDVDAEEVFHGMDPAKAESDIASQCAVKVTFHVQRFRDDSSAERTFLDDLCLLSNFNMDDAEEYARRIVRHSECHELMRRDAQKHLAVDKLANLIFTAPVAAFEVLDLLKVDPKVRDPGYHPIGNRSSLWNLPYNQAMRCAYHSDSTCESGLQWPEWSYNKQDEKKFPHWHGEFLPDVCAHSGRQDHIYEVRVKILLMPNLMDVDVMMAIARIWSFHDEVFRKMTLRAIVTCVWDGLMKPAFRVNMLFNLVEVAVLLSWGLTPSTGDFLPWELWSGEDQEGATVPCDAPFCWSILFAAVIRDFVNLVWWLQMYCYKWLNRPSFGGDEALQAPDKSQRLRQIFDRDVRHSMWHPWGFFSETTACRDIFVWALLLYFVVHTSGFHGDCQENATSRHVWLALNLTCQGLKTLWDLRLTTIVGVTILPVIKAVSSGPSFSMVVFASVLFTFACLSFQAVERDAVFLSAFMSLYRGLIFGDGDGLDAMNLKDWKDKPQTEEISTLTFLMFLFSFAFYVCMLNLLIAVYNNEYDRVAQLAESLQFQERAQATCKYLFSLQKIRLRGSKEYFILQFFQKLGWLVYLGVMGFCAALPCSLSGLLLALVQMTWQAAIVQSDWFPAEAGLARKEQIGTRSQEDLFLWIVHRHDYDEDYSRRATWTRELGHLREHVEDKVDRISLEVGKHVKRLDSELRRMDQQLNTRLQAMAERSETLAERSNSQVNALAEAVLRNTREHENVSGYARTDGSSQTRRSIVPNMDDRSGGNEDGCSEHFRLDEQPHQPLETNSAAAALRNAPRSPSPVSTRTTDLYGMNGVCGSTSAPPGNGLRACQASDPLMMTLSDAELPVASEHCAANPQPWGLRSERTLTEPQSWTTALATNTLDGSLERQSRTLTRGEQASRQPRVQSRGSQGSRSPALPWAMPKVVPPVVLPSVVHSAQMTSPRPWHVRSTSTGTPSPNPGAKLPAISSLEPLVSLGPGRQLSRSDPSTGYRSPQRTGASIPPGSNSVSQGVSRQVSGLQHLQAPGALVFTTAEPTTLGPCSVPPPVTMCAPTSARSWRWSSA